MKFGSGCGYASVETEMSTRESRVVGSRKVHIICTLFQLGYLTSLN